MSLLDVRKIIKIASVTALAVLFVAVTAYSGSRKRGLISSDLAEISEITSFVEISDTVSVSEGAVNINTATVEELCTLKGIGKARAEAIVKYREENGGFVSAEEIMRVKGIGEGIYNNIKDEICT